ncbi:DUF3987 domain-containing protein [Nodosilinea sp. LEGE 06152]|uniref:DUF3987 domain-containing protein n=1 Tax=Nodosilinea sp. LEGE 06152 TaxID=2777966 RepID=UPI0018826694|nr:DUF3987 domain-containing protein [Nodosilinea sp. LEGE 06152]MBE9160677.1 DUF3987 domain-containing protein [Nodosilinea sp. LEGE 06152]
MSHSKASDAHRQDGIRFSVFTASKGSAQKRLIPGPDGKPIKDPEHKLCITEAYSKARTVNSPQEFADRLVNLRGTNQAITLGTTGSTAKQQVVSTKHLADKPGAIARNKDYFSWPTDGYFPLLFDHDPEPGQPSLNADQFRAELIDLFPELAAAAWVQTVSSSSAIYDKATGECLKPTSGHHTYIFVRGDVERFKAILKTRCWLKGKAFFKLATANRATGISAVLERLLIDISVFSPERLVYEAGPLLPEQWEQRLPVPVVIDGDYIDLDTITEPTESQQAQADALREAEREIAQAQQLAQTLKRVIAINPGLSPAAAKAKATAAIASCNRGELAPGHMLYLADNRTITAGDIGPEHDGLTLRDPQEPTYRNGASDLAQIYWNDGNWRINSMAHGGFVYRLAMSPECPQNVPNHGDIALRPKTLANKRIREGVKGNVPNVPSFSKELSEPLVTNLDWKRLESLSKKSDLNPFELMPLQLRVAATDDAAKLSVQPIAIFSYLITICSSLMGKETKIFGSTSTKFNSLVEPNCIWMMLVADTSYKKSPVRNLVMGALEDMQKDAEDLYKLELENYEVALTAWNAGGKEKGEPQPQPPVQRDYYLEKGTSEGFAESLSKQSNGVFLTRDELPGLFSAMNQYKAGGKGDDEDVLLTSFNGKTEKLTNKNGCRAGFNSRLNIAGGIQPSVINRHFQSDDPRGMLGRFWMVIPDKIPTCYTEARFDLTDVLPELYQFLDDVTWGDVVLTPEAFSHFRDKIINVYSNEKPPIKAAGGFLGKFAGKILRLALVLHGIECYYNPDKNRGYVSLDTLKRAQQIGLLLRTHFYYQAGVLGSEDVVGIIDKIHSLAVDAGEDGISPRDVVKGSFKRAVESEAESSSPRMSPSDYVKALFSELAAKGLGEIVPSGKSVRFVAISKNLGTLGTLGGSKSLTPCQLKDTDSERMSPGMGTLWGHCGDIPPNSGDIDEFDPIPFDMDPDESPYDFKLTEPTYHPKRVDQRSVAQPKTEPTVKATIKGGGKK